MTTAAKSPRPAPVPDLLLPSQVAALLTMTTRAVVKMAKAGELPYVELPDGEILIDRADLIAWVDSRRRPVRQGAPTRA
jgi:hypothetical protein